jgi:hypothetical protein
MGPLESGISDEPGREEPIEAFRASGTSNIGFTEPVAGRKGILAGDW